MNKKEGEDNINNCKLATTKAPRIRNFSKQVRGAERFEKFFFLGKEFYVPELKFKCSVLTTKGRLNLIPKAFQFI